MSDSQARPVTTRSPDTLIILLCVAVVVAALSWWLPAGQFELDADGRVSLDSFTIDEQAESGVPVFAESGNLGYLNVMFEGLVAGDKWGSAVGIIAFLLIIGGSFGVIQSVGSLDRGILRLMGLTQNRPWLLLCVLFVLFSLGGAVFGMGEEAIAFALIVVPLVIRLGYNAIVGVLVTYGATQIGFATSWMNPFSVVIAQGIADLPPLSGTPYRLTMWTLCTLAALSWVLWYAHRMKRSPDLSLSADSDAHFRRMDQDQRDQHAAFSGLDWAVVGVVTATMVWVVWGVTSRGYYIPEIAAQFFTMGLVVGVLGWFSKSLKLTANDLADAFVEGAKILLPAALIVGLAKGIVLMLGGSDPQQASALNTILFYSASAMSDVASAVSAWLMLVFQSALNFLIASGSGQAALTMPIMAPLGDLVGVSRQVTVLAFQLGDGFTNLIVPTSAALMGTLGVARVDWWAWVRAIASLQLLVFILATVFVLGGHWMSSAADQDCVPGGQQGGICDWQMQFRAPVDE